MIAGLYRYVNVNKSKMLEKIQKEFHSSLNGDLIIKDIEPDFWKQFPSISFALKGVVIKDTNWSQHQQELLKVNNVFIQVKLLPLLIGKFRISKIILSQGTICLFADEYGYSNHSIFNTPKKGKPSRKSISLKRFEIEDVTFKFIQHKLHKDFDIHIDRLNGWIIDKKGKKAFRTKGSVFVRKLCFNTTKGSFVKNKYIDFDLNFDYTPKTKRLRFDPQNLTIENQNVSLSAIFDLQKEKERFKLDFTSKSINYKEAVSWVSPNIQHRLDSFIFEKPISLSVSIEGRLKNQPNPWINLKSVVRDNILTTRFGKFDSINFDAEYRNGSTFDTLFGDENSVIKLNKLSASYQRISFYADSTFVYNLKFPAIKTMIKGEFSIDKLNHLIGKKTFRFGKGTAHINLQYSGSLIKNSNIPDDIDGTIMIKNAEVCYLPRMLKFKNSNLNIYLHNQDIELKTSELHSIKSKIIVSATAKNFFTFYNTTPENVVFEASLFSPKLDLNEFETFLQKRSPEAKRKAKSTKVYMPDAIDKTFELSQTNLNIRVNDLVYRKFEAQEIAAKIQLLQNSIVLDNAQLKFAGGFIKLNGSLSDNSANNTVFSVNSTIQKVAIDKLLYGFGSFGQYTFLPENIKGTISLKSQLKGQFDSNGHLFQQKLQGTTSFEIENGELIHFKPLVRMGKLFFKRKRLENVHFKLLKNDLSIKGNEITIPPMLVQSDLINLKIGGLFHLKNGTNLNIEIPLFKEDIVGNSGYKLYVNGKDDENGNLHFSWSLKNKEISDARKERKRRKTKKTPLEE
jgi:uncharacterized protein involved in outer membrane biogenesis